MYIWAKFLGCPPRAAWARDPSGGNRLPRDFKNRRTVKIETERGGLQKERERTDTANDRHPDTQIQINCRIKHTISDEARVQ